MTEEAPRLSVVIPAFNEEARIGATLERVERWLREEGWTFELVVVDDGSTDRTGEVVREFGRSHGGVELVRLPRNRGKGCAVREGFARTRGELVLLSDADLSTPIEELAVFAEAFRDGVELAIASRALPDSRLEVRQAWYRETMGRTFNVFVRWVTGIPFRDTQCGFKLLGGEDARALAAQMREDGFSFDVELILLARRRGLTIREIPVTWRNVPASRVQPVVDSMRMLLSLPRILLRTGRYRD
jgi:dolichyl-phosphate beta-glucosyltransferase